MPGKSFGRRPLRRSTSAPRVASSPQPSALTADNAVNTVAGAGAVTGGVPSSRWLALPEIVEIEPVEGLAPALLLQTRGEPRHQRVQHVVAVGAGPPHALQE